MIICTNILNVNMCSRISKGRTRDTHSEFIDGHYNSSYLIFDIIHKTTPHNLIVLHLGL